MAKHQAQNPEASRLIDATIAALGAFYLSNRFTLSAIFGRELSDPERVAAWRDHIGNVVLAYARASDRR